MAIRVIATDALEVGRPIDLRRIASAHADGDACPAGGVGGPAAGVPSVVGVARVVQRMALQFLVEELEALSALPDHQPALEVAAAGMIRALAAEVLHAHRQVLRAQTSEPARPGSADLAHTGARSAVGDDLAAVLSALDECQLSLRRVRPGASDPRRVAALRAPTQAVPDHGGAAAHPRAACCAGLTEALRTTKWLLIGLPPGFLSFSPVSGARTG